MCYDIVMSELSYSHMNPADSVAFFSDLQINGQEIVERGRRYIETTNWQKVLGSDLQHYSDVAHDPDCTPTQTKAFSNGITHGYQLMIGLFSSYSEPSIDPASLTQEDVTLFREVISGTFPLPEDLITEEGFEIDDSSEYFFILLADKMAEDEQFSALIESYVELLKEQQFQDGDLAEYVVAGFLHGVASVYGLERLRYERNEYYIQYGIQNGIDDISKFLRNN